MGTIPKADGARNTPPLETLNDLAYEVVGGLVKQYDLLGMMIDALHPRSRTSQECLELLLLVQEMARENRAATDAGRQIIRRTERGPRLRALKPEAIVA